MATLNASVSTSFYDLTTQCRNGSCIRYVLFKSCPQEQLKRPSVYAVQFVPVLSVFQGFSGLPGSSRDQEAMPARITPGYRISSCESKERVLDQQSGVLGSCTISAANQGMTLT